MKTITITYHNGQVEKFEYATKDDAFEGFIDRIRKYNINNADAVIENDKIQCWTAGGPRFDFTMIWS